MNLAALKYKPEFQLELGERPIPEALKASIADLSFASGLTVADRVELNVYDPETRWLEDPRLALGATLALRLGYAPGPLEQVFVGKICTLSTEFPSNGAVSLTIAAQDARFELQRVSKTRWFAIASGSGPPEPMPDVAVAGIVASGQRLIPLFDPVSAGVSLLLGGVERAMALRQDNSVQKLIRKQEGQSDFDFLATLGAENGWSVLIDHSGIQGGRKLRFGSLAANTEPIATFEYGLNLLSFSPRLTDVGQVAKVSTSFYVPDIKTRFRASVGFDWDRGELTLELTPSFGEIPDPETKSEPELELAGKPANQWDAPRQLVAELLGRLNRRLTANAALVGAPELVAGKVVEIRGVGRFSGRYRIVDASHTLSSGGYATNLGLRREIWFDAPRFSAPTPALV